jgi:prepilin-type N-terminal cleavage/methylation domain-containing protein
MIKERSGFTLIEMLIVVAIIAVLAGVGFNYYGDSIEDARRNTVKMNLRSVKEAIARYFKDHMVYPTSLEQLHGPYLQQTVEQLVLTPLQAVDSNAKIEIKTPKPAADVNIYHVPEADTEWIDNLTLGRQFNDIRVYYQGTYLY